MLYHNFPKFRSTIINFLSQCLNAIIFLFTDALYPAFKKLVNPDRAQISVRVRPMLLHVDCLVAKGRYGNLLNMIHDVTKLKRRYNKLVRVKSS